MMYALPVLIRMYTSFIWQGGRPERSGAACRNACGNTCGGITEIAGGEYYYFQLIGLTVVSDAGDTVGTLTEIIETGANNVYAVKTAEGKEIYLPAIPSCVLSVQPKEKTMTVHLPEWE
ncbi:ribosome maturation factor RimM [Dialister invisus]|uniref:ribosome maturation factor RimM n=1 Tax=Dialister invisus TaxID=218538 RepID=UPI00399F1DF1